MSISINFSQFDKEKVDQAWEDILSGSFKDEDLSAYLKDFFEAQETKDKQSILEAILQLDTFVIEKYSKQSYNEYYHGEFEYFIQLLFQQTLGLDLTEQEYYKDDQIFSIPFPVWVEAFQKADKVALQNIKDILEKSTEEYHYTFEDFTKCMLPIKEVVRYCLETKTEMSVDIEGDPTKFKLKRAEAIYNKIH